MYVKKVSKIYNRIDIGKCQERLCGKEAEYFAELIINDQSFFILICEKHLALFDQLASKHFLLNGDKE